MASSIDYRSLFDSLPTAHLLIAPDLKIIEANTAFLQATGRGREELIGIPVFSAFPPNPDDPDNSAVIALHQPLTTVIATHAPHTMSMLRYPIARITPEGTIYEEHYWSVINTPVVDSSGKFAAVLQSVIDVTDTQRDITNMQRHLVQPASAQHNDQQQDGQADSSAESTLFTRSQTIQAVNQALEAERRRLRHLFDRAPGFVAFTRGPEHIYEMANPAFYELLGYRNLIGKPMREAVPELEQSVLVRMDEAYQSGNAFVGRKKQLFLQEHPGADRSAVYVDFVMQPIAEADGSISGLVIQGHDITEQKRSEAEIWRQANFDVLTELPNRRLFRDRLDQEVKKAQRNEQSVALFFIDLDHFKEANDLLGHDVGDLLLKEAGARIHACVRESDTVARLGGDEFTVILPALHDVSHTEQVAQKIIESLAEPFMPGNELVYLSASIGITLYKADASTPEDMIRNADQAMYAAKNAGRNQFSYFTGSMQQEARNRLRMISDLRNALHAGQFEVQYQPMLELSSQRIAKAEALLRWHHPRLGLVDPGRFIPLAEESGLINEIGDWVFREAATCSQRWSERFDAPFQISVNQSPIQFFQRSQGMDWPNHLKDRGLSGGSILIDISEALLIKASSNVTNQLLHYRDAGIQVALDDFGTGYSSMSYLQKFDIDYLKIDQSFVQRMTTSAGDSAIVRSIILMAHELGLKVIAEGIETSEQNELLVAAGCDYGQGFLFSQAVPSEHFEQMLINDAFTTRPQAGQSLH
jgi:diguanylate cyclase (GGDEF)-like protein/PAS domain S-box-containing protein